VLIFPKNAGALEACVNSASLVLSLLDEAYEEKTWHGPNLKQSLKGVTARQAAWRPGPRRHNIWEFTLHAAYWKYTVRRRLLGEKRGSFALEGSNFFAAPKSPTEAAWREARALLEREHNALVAAVADPRNSRTVERKANALYGVAFHDIYHAGQIRLLRRLQGKRG
jgi:hypothetical protein